MGKFKNMVEIDVKDLHLITQSEKLAKRKSFNKEKLIQQHFIGAVVEIIGWEKTVSLLKEANKTFEFIADENP